MKSWKRVAGTALTGALVCVGLASVWGVGIEPRLIDERYEAAELPNLPLGWEGRQIAVIADLQVGMWLDNTDTIRRIVARIVELRPAAVLVAGDFVYDPTDDDPGDTEREDYRDFRGPIAEVAELLRPLGEAGIPTYAVLGNHDYGMPTAEHPRNELLARAVRRMLGDLGIRVLDNRAAPLTIDGALLEDALYVVGVGDRTAGQDRPEEALAGVPPDAARIALMHDPHSFAAFPTGSVPLAIAGHTHGGQLRVPFTSNWTWMRLVSEERVFSDGWIDLHREDGARLYVNRGIGFSVLPARINCPPELTVFTLRRSVTR